MPLPDGITTIELTGSYAAPDGTPLGGQVSFVPSSVLTDPDGQVILSETPLSARLQPGTGTFSITLACTDNDDLLPEGWQWRAIIQVPGATDSFYFDLPSTLGDTHDISALTPHPGAPAASGSYVSSINGQTGDVELGDGFGILPPAGDLGGGTTLAPQVTSTHLAAPLPIAQGGTGAASGSAALSALGGISSASPAFTGTPTAPTATPLTNTTQLATTAYADAATAVEKSRAQTAEALLAPKASPALTGTPTAPTASPGANSTQVATTAYADAAAASGAGSALQKSSNLSDLANAGTARTNLGLGTAATLASAAVAQTANNLSDLASASTARTNLGLTGAATASLPLSQSNGGTGSSSRNFAGLLTQTSVKTSAYTASPGDFVTVDTTSAAVTVTLPNAPADLTVVAVEMIASAATPNAVTIATAGSDVFNKAGGATTLTLSLPEQSAVLQYQASSHIWLKQSGDIPLAQLDGRYNQRPSATEHTYFVSTASYASDSNDGLSVHSAKATIAGALTALGGAAGVIQLGYGTFGIGAADVNGNGVTLTAAGTVLQGLGYQNTVIQVNTSVTYGVLAQAQQCILRDFLVQAGTGATVTFGAGVTTTTSAEKCVFSGVRVNSGSGTVTNGFAVSPEHHADIADTNFFNCSAVVYANAGWYLGDGTSGNVLDTRMFGCTATGGTYGIYDNAGGGFAWYGGDFGENTTADIYLAGMTPGDKVVVDGARSENSAAMLGSANNGVSFNVAIKNYIFQTSDAFLASTGAFISYGFSGSLTLDNVTARNASGSIQLLALFSNQVSNTKTLTVSATNCKTTSPLTQLFCTTATQFIKILVESYTQTTSTGAIAAGQYVAGPVVFTPASTSITINGTSRFPAQASASLPALYSPCDYGAVGDGTTDDTTALQAAAAAAAAAGGIIDLGTKTFKTSSPITVGNNFRMRGSSFGGGGITNSASDIFTVSGSVNTITFENLTLTASGGHIWNASSGPSTSFWRISGVQALQNSASFGIYYQVGGLFIDCVVDGNSFFRCASGATVSPWSIASSGGVNSVKFSRLRCAAQGAVVKFFSFDMGSTNGWNEDIVFDHVTWEVCTGGALAMSGCVDVLISMCANWDIPAARSDTGCGTTNGSPTVTDPSAVSGDLGKAISGPGIPALATIIAVSAGTGYTISANATATAGSLTFITGGVAANFYSFTKSTAGYPCRNIQVKGGRAGGNSTALTGFNDFFADSFATNVMLDSFGSWATAPIVSSPAAQTTYLNMTVASGSPQATAPAISAAGLPGATAASRYAGATVSGAPSSGTFAAGDYVIDQTGAIWICASGGTPGTWTSGSPVAPNIQYFTSGGSWTKPSGAKLVSMTVIGCGGPGGSGRQDAAGTARCGGGGGAGGGINTRLMDASDITSTVTVTIGNGGTGGAAIAGGTGTSNGNAGTAGGNTSFGSYLIVPGAFAGAGGTSSSGTAGSALFGGSNGGAAAANGGGAGGNGGGGNVNFGGVGGAAGGGISSANVAFNGGSGVFTSLTGGQGTAGAAGVVDTTSPTSGTAPTTKGNPATGAGGGAASITTAAQAGANGNQPGGGGGGGGAALNGNGSGAGGNGGAGAVLVVTYFQ